MLRFVCDDACPEPGAAGHFENAPADRRPPQRRGQFCEFGLADRLFASVDFFVLGRPPVVVGPQCLARVGRDLYSTLLLLSNYACKYASTSSCRAWVMLPESRSALSIWLNRSTVCSV